MGSEVQSNGRVETTEVGVHVGVMQRKLKMGGVSSPGPSLIPHVQGVKNGGLR